MVITKTPFRMSFFGGGTDVESYFRENGGAVLSTTFDKYCYVNARHLPPFFEYTTEIAYSQIERVTDIDAIRHPAVRNAMKMLYMHEIRLTYEADLPARSGLGTSSSFAVGMLNAFYAMKGQYVDKKRLADDAICLERKLCGESGGWQDQIAASFGGLNRINFEGDDYEVIPIVISPERKKRLNQNLLLFFTGIPRYSFEVQQVNDRPNDADRKAVLREMRALVDEAEKILVDWNGDLDEFGRLLDYNWQLKKRSGSSVSLSVIDDYYRAAMEAGALGGKLLGAGRGGFMIFYVQPDKQEQVKAALENLMWIPFSFEEGGTRIVHYTAEMYTSKNRWETREKSWQE